MGSQSRCVAILSFAVTVLASVSNVRAQRNVNVAPLKPQPTDSQAKGTQSASTSAVHGGCRVIVTSQPPGELVFEQEVRQ